MYRINQQTKSDNTLVSSDKDIKGWLIMIKEELNGYLKEFGL